MSSSYSSIIDKVRSGSTWRQARCDSALKCPTNITLFVAIVLVQILYYLVKEETISFGRSSHVVAMILYYLTLILAIVFVIRLFNKVMGTHVLEKQIPYVRQGGHGEFAGDFYGGKKKRSGKKRERTDKKSGEGAEEASAQSEAPNNHMKFNHLINYA